MNDPGLNPAISVIVPARNAAATIEDTLSALAAQDLDLPYEVIVVDNGSDDGTAELAEAAPGPVTVIRQGRERAGAARNRGSRAARAEALAFTDADCVPAPAWLREGLAALEQLDLVQGAVRSDPQSAAGPFDRSVSVGDETGLYETASLFVSRRLFDTVGGFDEVVRVDLEAPFGEDVWFGWRARRAGGKTGYCERAVVDHAVVPRGPLQYVAESGRRGLFPALVAKIPELRREFLFAGLFLTRRTAAFDLAVVAAVAAAWASTPAPLVGVAPYLAMVASDALRWGGRAPAVAAAGLAADVLGFAGLLTGSVRSRSIVL